ncbi:MAG: ATP synthase F0 subunit C [Proteobacteria bacterium]|nr:ATP synthase F0 subunit C [Pseudomonadota bacterium]
MEQGLVALAAGLAIGLGAFGAATAQAKAAAATFEGVTRNPSSKDAVFVPFILALAFMEFQAILAFIVAFLLLQG